MARGLSKGIADGLADIVDELGGDATFGGILLEARRSGLVSHNVTLRKYLDLLVEADVLTMRRREVGSVYPAQLYKLRSKGASLHAGLRVLHEYGLNWEVPPDDLYKIVTDLRGLVRSRKFHIGPRDLLCASFEDSIANELLRDASKGTGNVQLIIGLLGSKASDLPYLLTRADGLGVGAAVRSILRRIVGVYTTRLSVGDGRIYLATREHALRILRLYSKQGVLNLVEESGTGKKATEIVGAISDETIVSSIGKQLGITG